jgi:hypothetical protein
VHRSKAALHRVYKSHLVTAQAGIVHGHPAQVVENYPASERPRRDQNFDYKKHRSPDAMAIGVEDNG